MNKISTLDKIDNYFDTKGKNYFYMAILLLALVIGYLVYDNTYEDSEMYLEENTEKLEKSKQTLEKLNSYIQTHTVNKTIENKKSQYQKLTEKKLELDEQNDYFDEQFQKAAKLLYNQKNWSNFMNKINVISSKYRLKVGNLQNNINSLSGLKVEEAFNISFDLQGKFQNILNFINDLERAVDVVDVKSISFTPAQPTMVQDRQSNKTIITNTNSVKVDVKISIWGIKY